MIRETIAILCYARFDDIALSPQFTDAPVDLRYQHHLLEVPGTHAVTCRMTADVLFGNVVVTLEGLQNFEDALLLRRLLRHTAPLTAPRSPQRECRGLRAFCPRIALSLFHVERFWL